jgi:hypothetical protein
MRTAFICVTFAVTSPQERIYISAGVTRRPFGFQPKGWVQLAKRRQVVATVSKIVEGTPKLWSQLPEVA